ncbi:MAG: glycosyltransferase family 2 protein [Gammaproteobacteria bacterium]|nr:glycosyltransferase family 2 protein [Gammaproteobacteria bacterium]
MLVNWNGWRECIECLDALLAQDHRALHVIIVDNASEDDSLEHIARWCDNPVAHPAWRSLPGVVRLTAGAAPGSVLYRRIASPPADALAEAPPGCMVTLIEAGENRGFAAGCNIGMRAAGAGGFDYYWLLNPDTVVAHDALAELVARAGVDARVGMVGSTILYYHRPEFIEALGGARVDLSDGASRHIGQGTSATRVPRDGGGVEEAMAYVMGASMLVSASFVREIGPMAEDYFLYYEEIDWAMRARGKFLPGYAPRSRVYHKSGANSSKVVPMRTARYYYRNRLRFVARYLPERLGAARRSLLVEMLRHLARGRWQLARVVGSVLIAAPKT